MSTRLPRIVCTALLTAALGACARQAPPVAQAAAEPDGPILIENFSLGTRLGPSGGIARGAAESTFGVGQLIYLAMELKRVPPGTNVRVVWQAEGDIVLGEETKAVRSGQRFLNFAADSGSLPLEPKYHVEVFVNGQAIKRLEFGLVMAAV